MGIWVILLKAYKHNYLEQRNILYNLNKRNNGVGCRGKDIIK